MTSKRCPTWLVSLALAALLTGCDGMVDGDHIAAAKTQLAKKDQASAIIELKAALQKSPGLAEARFLLGIALLQQGDPTSALVELDKARDLGYSDDMLAPTRARALAASGKFKDIVQNYGGVTLANPKAQAELRAALAVAQLSLGQAAEAQTAVVDALKSDPDNSWALQVSAQMEASTGKIDKALALIDRAISQSRSSGDAYLLKAAILRYGKKDAQGAIAAYEKAALDPLATIEARTGLIQLAIVGGNRAEAKSQLAKLQKSHPKNLLTLYIAAIVAYSERDYALAESTVETILRVYPDNPKLLVLGGAASLQKGNLIAAESKLGKVVQTRENVPLARRMLADTYLRMGQPDKTLNVLRPMLQQGSADGDSLALAGQAELQSGNPQRAEEYFSAALKSKPDSPQIRTALALADVVKGDSKSAFDALQDIAAKDSGDTADLALISLRMRRGEYDAALAAVSALERKSPGNAMISHLRGVALRGKGDLAGARSAFEAALQIDPRHYASVAGLVDLDVQQNNLPAARQRLEAAIKVDGRNTAARIALVDIRSRQGAEPAELLAAIDAAVQAAPYDAAPHLAKILQLARMNDSKAAASAAQTAMAALPQDVEVLNAAGQALEVSGDTQQALTIYNRMASLMPGSPVPYLRVAALYAKRGDLRGRWSSLARAFEVAPASTEVHRRMVAYARASKDYKPVLDAAKSLQKSQPSSALGFLFEGDAAAQRKDWPAALAAYRTALNKSGVPVGLPPRLVQAALIASGDAAGAQRFSLDWLQSHPKETEFRSHLAGEALTRKDYPTAEKLYAQVVDIDPRDVVALNNLAWLLAERGDSDAVAVAEKALALVPGSAPVLDTLAKAHLRAGQFERAIDAERKAIALIPDRHQYRLNLAKIYLRAGKRREAEAELDALAKLGAKFDQAQVAQVRKDLSF